MQPAHRRSLLDCIGDADYAVFEALSLRDQGALSRVSKTSRAIIEPFMYTHIDLRWYGFEENKRTPIGKLLRTLLHRPDLAAHVRRVILV